MPDIFMNIVYFIAVKLFFCIEPIIHPVKICSREGLFSIKIIFERLSLLIGLSR